MKKAYFIVAVSSTLFFAGCGSQTVNLPNLNLASKTYENATSLAGFSFSMAQPTVNISTNLSSTLRDGLGSRLKYDADAIYCKLTDELQKVLISKGFAINSVFKSQNDMTFSEKRNTSALFYPVINITIQENTITTYIDNVPMRASGRLMVTSGVGIYMIEPLSNEKVWVKNIDANDVDVPIAYSITGHLGKVAMPGSAGALAGSHMVSKELAGVADSLDRLFVDIYDKILDVANKHISVEEFQMLNVDIKKLKDIKRY